MKITLPTTAAQAAPPIFLRPDDPLRSEALQVFRASKAKHETRLRQAQQHGDTITAQDAAWKLNRRHEQITALQVVIDNESGAGCAAPSP